MQIEDFNVSEKCRNALKRVGFTTVEEIAEFLEQEAKTGPNMIDAEWIRYFEEIIDELKRLGLWSATLQQYWPNL